MFDRYQQRIIIRFLHKERVQPAEIHQRFAAQPCKDLYSKWSIEWWCVQFVCGREEIEDDYRSGKPPIDHLGTKILACLESEPFQSAYSLAEVLAVSQATALNRLHNLLGMKNFHVRWVPPQLTSELQARRLPMLKAMQKNNFRKVMTGNESRFSLKTGHSAQWSVCRDDVGTTTKPTIGAPKFMLTVMWGIKGFHVVDLMTSQNQFNSQYFVEHIMVPLVQEIFLYRRNRGALPLHLHRDNRQFTSQQWQDGLVKQLPSCGFHIFPTAQIWRLLTFPYSGILKPPSRGLNSMNQSNF
jgi:hypothetical protein